LRSGGRVRAAGSDFTEDCRRVTSHSRNAVKRKSVGSNLSGDREHHELPAMLPELIGRQL